jgi:purine-binding chemotaxis protein CheW
MDSVTYYLSFRVGHEWFGVNVDDVVQVLHLVALTELPVTTPDVLGLITVREEIMPVIDLRRHFNLGSTALQLDTPLIAVRTSNGPVALVVDEAEDVLQVRGTEFSRYEGTESSYIKGVIRLQNRLLLLLDAAYLRSRVHVKELDDVEEPVPA